jgi:hypothetical protein
LFYNNWIVFTHEKSDFSRTSDLAKVLQAKGQEQVDILTGAPFEQRRIESSNDFYLNVMNWSSQIISRFGMPDYIYHAVDKNDLSDYNEGIFPVELNEQARIYHRIEEIKEKGINSASFKDFPKSKVPFGMIVVDKGEIEFIGEKPKKDSKVYVVSNKFSSQFPLNKVLDYFKENPQLYLFSMFPSPGALSCFK